MVKALKPLVVTALGKIASIGPFQQRFNHGTPRAHAASVRLSRDCMRFRFAICFSTPSSLPRAKVCAAPQ